MKSLQILILALSMVMPYSGVTRQNPGADSILNVTLYSKILGQDRELIIHLPRKYDPGKKYPVMYVLDGSSQDQHITDKFDSLSGLARVSQTIVVGIPNMSGANRTLQLVPPFMLTDPAKAESPPGTGDTFLDFMELELIPFIAEKYRGSEQRLFAGNSRGGLLVMYSLIYKPDLFTGRFCFSTPLWRQNNLLVSRVSEFLASKKRMNSFLYVSAGANETENIKSGLDTLTQVLKQKAPIGFVWYTYFTPGVDHQLNANVSATDGILQWGAFVKKQNNIKQK
jgi:predicted alpha/beta superfamily hydrolase